MRKVILVVVSLFILVLLASACVPVPFIAPVEIHMDTDDEITQVSIAIDANEIKYIAGVVNHRIVYYRTRYGEKHPFSFTMVMTGSGPNWKQFNPEIAVLDNGTAYIVWVEQRGTHEKFACWRDIPLIPPLGGYQKSCKLLDHGTPFPQTAGLVHVVARGNAAYAVYDRLDTGSGYVESLWYKNLSAAPNTPLKVYSYFDFLEFGYIYHMDLAIDSAGKLHLAYIDEYNGAPYPRLWYRSNAQVNAFGDMSQIWLIPGDVPYLNPDISPSITLHTADGPERVAIASVWDETVSENIYIDSCSASTCSNKNAVDFRANLPMPAWASPQISAVKITGFLDNYAVSFIADNNATTHPQVWYWVNPFTSNPTQVTDNTHQKFGLSMVDGFIPIVGFMEHYTSGPLPPITHLYKVSIYDANSNLREVHTTLCPAASMLDPSWDLASYMDPDAESVPVAGVWNVCGKTRFSTNAESVYTLTVIKAGTGSGTVTSVPVAIDCGTTCSVLFDEGTEVTLTAAASAGSTFTGWSGAGCSGTGTCQVTMDAAKSVTATFTLEEEPFSFDDVPDGYWAEDYIYRLHASGITIGCSQVPPLYCPEDDVTRAEMAVFLERGLNDPGYLPPLGTGTLFADVPITYWAVSWIEQLYDDGITVGCDTGPLRYCPDQSVTRAEMAAFLLRAKYGAGYTPPVVTESQFVDVPLTHWAVNWIAKLAADEITTGVTPTQFNPEGFVTRAQMAAFLVRTFELP